MLQSPTPKLSCSLSQGKSKTHRSRLVKPVCLSPSKDKQSESIIDQFVKGTLKQKGQSRANSMFVLPKRYQKLKRSIDNYSERKVSKTIRICEQARQSECLPRIKLKTYKNSEKARKKQKFKQKSECSQPENHLPTNSRLRGFLAQHNKSTSSSVKTVHKIESLNESEVHIVFQCDQEDQANGKSLATQQRESQFCPQQLAHNNPLEIKTLFARKIDASFQNRYKSQPNNLIVNSSILVTPIGQIEKFINSYEPKTDLFKIKDLILSPFFQVKVEGDLIYFGEVVEGKRQGNGVEVCNGQFYEGYWAQNQIVKGCFYDQNGCYKGKFFQRKRHGKGEYKSNDGARYVGEWLNDLRHGQGFFYSENTGISYLGSWVQDRPNGLGVFKKRGFSTYEGGVLDWMPQGEGVESFQNGDEYNGSYVGGLPSGAGKYRWKNGYQFEGSFRQGLRQGKGSFSAFGIVKFSGSYKKDLPNGTGRAIYVNGDEYQGELAMGLRHGGGVLTCKAKKQIFDGQWIEDKLVMPSSSESQF